MAFDICGIVGAIALHYVDYSDIGWCEALV